MCVCMYIYIYIYIYIYTYTYIYIHIHIHIKAWALRRWKAHAYSTCACRGRSKNWKPSAVILAPALPSASEPLLSRIKAPRCMTYTWASWYLALTNGSLFAMWPTMQYKTARRMKMMCGPQTCVSRRSRSLTCLLGVQPGSGRALASCEGATMQWSKLSHRLDAYVRKMSALHANRVWKNDAHQMPEDRFGVMQWWNVPPGMWSGKEKKLSCTFSDAHTGMRTHNKGPCLLWCRSASTVFPRRRVALPQSSQQLCYAQADKQYISASVWGMWPKKTGAQYLTCALYTGVMRTFQNMPACSFRMPMDFMAVSDLCICSNPSPLLWGATHADTSTCCGATFISPR
jgi:hypothetical protein